MGKVDVCSHDTEGRVLLGVFGCAKRRVFSRAMARSVARGERESLALPENVGRPSGHGSPCRGGRVMNADGLPAKEVSIRL
ncbi:hypothetical protein CDL15_Pgr017253 [Punica granatum]|nr:hypothetical protein CDL15_Pgr017253 [Punica granatum]